MRETRDACEAGWTLSLIAGSPAVDRLLESTGPRDYLAWECVS